MIKPENYSKVKREIGNLLIEDRRVIKHEEYMLKLELL